MLAEIRERLADDISEAERREIVQLLVRRITVHTTLPDSGRKQVQVVIDYRFPPVVQTRTGIAASPATISPALSPPEPELPLATDLIRLQAAAGLSQFQFPQLDRLHGAEDSVEGPGNAPISRSHASLRNDPGLTADVEPVDYRMPRDVRRLSQPSESVLGLGVFS